MQIVGCSGDLSSNALPKHVSCWRIADINHKTPYFWDVFYECETEMIGGLKASTHTCRRWMDRFYLELFLFVEIKNQESFMTSFRHQMGTYSRLFCSCQGSHAASGAVVANAFSKPPWKELLSHKLHMPTSLRDFPCVFVNDHCFWKLIHNDIHAAPRRSVFSTRVWNWALINRKCFLNSLAYLLNSSFHSKVSLQLVHWWVFWWLFMCLFMLPLFTFFWQSEQLSFGSCALMWLISEVTYFLQTKHWTFSPWIILCFFKILATEALKPQTLHIKISFLIWTTFMCSFKSCLLSWTSEHKSQDIMRWKDSKCILKLLRPKKTFWQK